MVLANLWFCPIALLGQLLVSPGRLIRASFPPLLVCTQVLSLLLVVLQGLFFPNTVGFLVTSGSLSPPSSFMLASEGFLLLLFISPVIGCFSLRTEGDPCFSVQASCRYLSFR